ncbi:DHHA1 domain-containing protein, partial [Pseudomonas sp. NPDC087346]|uniref:DHHA1 domain-containing protein n=1 Tax=Pseudomonas sp. NPDC087346 TaxID=3364438 RepID=UPI00382D18CC
PTAAAASFIKTPALSWPGGTKDQTGQQKTGGLMKQAAAAVGGKGGGRPDMAQGGGVDAGALDGALALTVPFVEQGL